MQLIAEVAQGRKCPVASRTRNTVTKIKNLNRKMRCLVTIKIMIKMRLIQATCMTSRIIIEESYDSDKTHPQVCHNSERNINKMPNSNSNNSSTNRIFASVNTILVLNSQDQRITRVRE